MIDFGPYLEIRELRLGKETLRQERRSLERFGAFLEENDIADLPAITDRHILDYYGTLCARCNRYGKPVSKSFLQQSLLSVRGFLVWAFRQKLILQDFSGTPIPKRKEPLPVIVSAALMKRLLAFPQAGCPLGERDRMLLECLYVLGLRIGEVVAIDLQHIDFGAQTVVVTGKGGHQRLLPLSPRLLHVLSRYLKRWRPKLGAKDSEKALFVSRFRRRLTKQSAYLRVRFYGEQLGLKLTPHLLRHTCATHLVEGGADLFDISRFLGHQRVESTQRYARCQTFELERCYRSSHPRALYGGAHD